ncbi:MAG: ATP-dependent DNA helicase [Bacteroidales bacterium]|nr:ATP-dependent DNA helicase [Bacteroidales bacterium]
MNRNVVPQGEPLVPADLNEDQKKIVLQTDGPVLVIAGPGSGKTKTLVDRIVHLVRKDVPPEAIMVCTFTEKAARELITRVSNQLLENDIAVNLNEMYIGTMHSIFLRILEENEEFTRLKHAYRLFDQFEQSFVIYRNIREFLDVEDIVELIGDNKSSLWHKAENIAKQINVVAEEMLNVDLLAKSRYGSVRALAACHRIYERILEEENALDFSTIQSACYRLLNEHPDVLSKIQDKVRYFMVDEYQDTNTIQEQIMLLLASRNHNLCVVGDDDQGLYRFRGATIRNILEFAQNFREGECKTFYLQTNYRSHPDIIRFYNEYMHDQFSIVGGEKFRFDKTIVPHAGDFPDMPAVLRLSVDINEQADEEEDAPAIDDNSYCKEVLRFINYLKSNEIITDYNQIAFLYRSVKSDKATELADYLERHGVRVFSPRSDMFFQREEVRLILGCLVALFPQVEDLLSGEYDQRELDQCVSWYNFFFDEIEKDPATHKELLRWLGRKISSHADLRRNTDYGFTVLVYQMLQFPLFSKYIEVDLGQNATDLRAAYNIGILTQLLSRFEYLYNITVFTPKNLDKTLRNFFRYYLNFLKDGGLGEYEDFDETLPSGCVSFMTIHQAKGLEFPVTVVGSMGLVPRKSYTDLDEILQREYFHKPMYEPIEKIKYFDFARLFYTAFSRAQNLLLLTGKETNRLPSKYFRDYWERIPKWDAPGIDLRKVNLATVKPVNVKHEYSFTSHILLYEGCPRQYKFYKELEFVEERKGGTMGGTLLHQTIEDIHRAVLRGESNTLTTDNITTWFNTNYQLLVKQLHSYLDEPQRKAILKQVLRYRDRNEGNWERIKEAEVDVSLVKEDYILKGTIDLVTGEDGTVELVDFKSGDKPDVNTTDEFKRNVLNQYRRQLEVYAYLVEQRYGQKVSRMHLYYPKEENGNPRITFPYRQQNVEATIGTFEEVVRRIERKDFDMGQHRRNEKHCSDCDLRHYCGGIKN